MPVFDENGNTIEGAAEETPEIVADTEIQENPEAFDNSDEADAPGEVAEGDGKYRIGSKSFATLAEAHAYAQSHINELETTVQVTDAYRQGIRDALSQPTASSDVTQQQASEDDFNEEEYYADPKAFLKKFKSQVQNEVLSTIESTRAKQEQTEQVWREFGDRHPMYADKEFRRDIEEISAANADTLKLILATKGKDAAFDYCALKLREKIDRYAQALKPSRKLSNTTQGASPTMGNKSTTSVTPKKGPQKPMTFVEQLKKIKKKS